LRLFPCAIHSTAVARRRFRVSSVFASAIQSTYSRRLPGEKASKAALAPFVARSAPSRSGGTTASFFGTAFGAGPRPSLVQTRGFPDHGEDRGVGRQVAKARDPAELPHRLRGPVRPRVHDQLSFQNPKAQWP
jgi:hypothetical protein